MFLETPGHIHITHQDPVAQQSSEHRAVAIRLSPRPTHLPVPASTRRKLGGGQTATCWAGRRGLVAKAWVGPLALSALLRVLGDDADNLSSPIIAHMNATGRVHVCVSLRTSTFRAPTSLAPTRSAHARPLPADSSAHANARSHPCRTPALTPARPAAPPEVVRAASRRGSVAPRARRGGSGVNWRGSRWQTAPRPRCRTCAAPASSAAGLRERLPRCVAGAPRNCS